MQRIQGHVRGGGLRLEPRELRRFVGCDEPLGDVHENLGRGAWRETFEQELAARRSSRAPSAGRRPQSARLPTSPGCTDHDLGVAPPAALTLDGTPHSRSLMRSIASRVFPLEGQCVGDAHVPDPDDGRRIAVDLLEEPLDETMIGSEVHLGAMRNARERDAVGGVELCDELAGRVHHALAASRRDAPAIGDDHDQPSAGASPRWSCKTQPPGRAAAGISTFGRDRDELRRHDGTRLPVDTQVEVFRRQVANRPAVSVNGADVHLNQVD